MALVFYDIETTGTSKHFDQIVQFAAIRTDADLNEIARFEIRSRLQPHIIPSPGALHATRMSIEDILDPGRPSHYEMVCAIRSALGPWCPATFLGFNSLRFDEEMLRQAFYQTLHPAYLTNTGGSGRSDVLNIVRAATLLFPGILSVPIRENGKPTFKLDRLAPANGFAHLNAHDALADVEATIHICRLIKVAAPMFWAQVLRLSRKATAVEFVEETDAFVLLETFGAGAIASPVTPLGRSAQQPNLVYCHDLRCDPGEIAALDDEELGKRLRRSPRLIRRLKLNASPIAIPLAEAPRHLLGGLPLEGFQEAAEGLRHHPDLISRLIIASEPQGAAHEPSPHVEQQLYEGFWSDADGLLMEDFQRSPWEDRVVIAGRLEDVRLRRLARRIVFSERPDLLPDNVRSRMAEEVRKRRQGDEEMDVRWLTVSGAVDALEALLADLPPEAQEGFAGYRAFLASPPGG